LKNETQKEQISFVTLRETFSFLSSMASNNNVPQIYSWVIQDVVEKMGRKFAELGLDENVLTDLRQVLPANIDMGGENPTIGCRTVR
jgi:hypothetical protein